MHGRVGTSVLVAASLWSGAAIAGVAPEAIALQPPGTFHEGEAVARDGESWLALRTVGGDADDLGDQHRGQLAQLRVLRHGIAKSRPR